MNSSSSIYGGEASVLPLVMNDFISKIQSHNEAVKNKTHEESYEHLNYRIKSEDSMREKCRRKGFPETPVSALRDIHDAIGVRIVCCFRGDIYDNIAFIKSIPGCQVIKEKDYIKNAKPNGYRSFHMILLYESPHMDVDGHNPGRFYIEVQLRTIAMDSWASLEHQMKYKHTIKNTDMIVRELKRCADELASCDVTMETIRHLIKDES
jgi:putative GTP pyrophosphokinase